jgi:hypothetical protein
MLRPALHAASAARLSHRVTLMALFVVLLLAHLAAAQDCSRMYRSGGKPLLFGGLGESGRCVGDCQSRDSFW